MSKYGRRRRWRIGLLGLTLAGCQAGGAETGEAAPGDGPELARAEGTSVTVYKSPTCGCCANWVLHMREAGFDVKVVDTDQLAQVKLEQGVPASLQSCHTAVIGDYVFEGHVPPETILRFLKESPEARGLAVPGMPAGSPGMEMGGRVDPYDVVQFDGLRTEVYESHR